MGIQRRYVPRLHPRPVHDRGTWVGGFGIIAIFIALLAIGWKSESQSESDRKQATTEPVVVVFTEGVKDATARGLYVPVAH